MGINSTEHHIEVWQRDEGVCQYCGADGDGIDHIIPWSWQRNNSAYNLVVSCDLCSSKAIDLVFKSFKEKRQHILIARGLDPDTDPPVKLEEQPTFPCPSPPCDAENWCKGYKVCWKDQSELNSAGLASSSFTPPAEPALLQPIGKNETAEEATQRDRNRDPGHAYSRYDRPTFVEVLTLLDDGEERTCQGICTALDLPWARRGTVRNRLEDLVEMGLVIKKGKYPALYRIGK